MRGKEDITSGRVLYEEMSGSFERTRDTCIYNTVIIPK